MSAVEKLKKDFENVFGESPEVAASAPGRVNLIGEHTDYNGGFVLPAAIAARTYAAGRRTGGSRAVVWSANLGSKIGIDLDESGRTRTWADYPKGVALKLREAGFDVRGFEAAFASDVPTGSGLSSSAAIEVATAFLLNGLFGFEAPAETLALACHKAEREFAGVNCGIMDQFVSAAAREGHALFLDCREVAARQIPFRLDGMSVVVLDTGVKHNLASSGYNERRAQCEGGQAVLGRSLREVGLSDIEQMQDRLGETVARRLRHVVTENQRVLDAVAALEAGEAERFGALMYASHESLRRDYEVSCAELDLIVDEASKTPGALGARLTGAGFGGCAIALARDEAKDELIKRISETYGKKTGIALKTFSFVPSAGANIEKVG